MKKLFLIPLMSLLCTVMAWGDTRTAGTFQQLQDALAAAVDGDVIELTKDIAYPTNETDLINITKSITLDGKGHKLGGWGTANISVSGTQNWPVTLAVNYGGEASAALDVTIQNLHVSNKVPSGNYNRSYGLMAWDGVDKLTLKNDSIYLGQSAATYKQPLCVTGTNETPINLKIEDSFIGCAVGVGYPAYILKPVKATLKNTEFSGYCSLYFKYRATPAYGNVVGARGSVVNADACTFNSINKSAGASNNFAVFVLEDDGITLNLHNCSMNAENLANNKGQRLVNLQYNTREDGATGQDVNVYISGDNTHIYHIENANTFIWNGFVVGEKSPGGTEGLSNQTFSDINVTISGGTLNINPENVHWFVKADGKTKATAQGTYKDQSTGTGAIIIPDGYEVKEVNQGGVDVWRVVKKAAKDGDVFYNLNQLVVGEGESAGVNPTSAFEVQADITLAQNTTKAGHVLVTSGDAVNHITVTVPENKTFVVNNGLDVAENAEVVVEPGSALLIGEGGIITDNASSIVLNASEENGAALLMHPDIKVNNEPTLTVKMYTASRQLSASPYTYQYHRFAIPVQSLSGAPANSYSSQPLFTGETGFETYVLSWNGAKWVSESAWSALKPFTGYLLANNTQGGGITYTFTGELYGNTDDKCVFTDRGFGYFGNSYTAPIYIKNFISGFGPEMEASVWIYDYNSHNFKSVNGEAIFGDEEEEIAPMQSFVLNLKDATSGEAKIDYKSAIWENPRFDEALGRTPASPAPARSATNIGNAARIKVVAENGMADQVTLIEGNTYSEAFENGVDASKFIFNEGINLYATTAEGDLSIMATDNIENTGLTFKAGVNTEYTLIVDKTIGQDYAIRDNVTGAMINCAEGAEYTFTQAANSTATGRFQIITVAKVPTAIENTEVKANVKGIYTLTGQYVGEDFKALPAGVYVVNGVKIVK